MHVLCVSVDAWMCTWFSLMTNDSYLSLQPVFGLSVWFPSILFLVDGGWRVKGCGRGSYQTSTMAKGLGAEVERSTYGKCWVEGTSAWTPKVHSLAQPKTKGHHCWDVDFQCLVTWTLRFNCPGVEEHRANWCDTLDSSFGVEKMEGQGPGGAKLNDRTGSKKWVVYAISSKHAHVSYMSSPRSVFQLTMWCSYLRYGMSTKSHVLQWLTQFINLCVVPSQ